MKGFDIAGLFFNPNIHPEDELVKRTDSLKDYALREGLKVAVDDLYDVDLFNREVAAKPGDRCLNCYRLRLERTAYCAGQNGIKKFSTTILISPYQKHELVKQAGEEAAKKYGVDFYYEDFRPLYKASVALSKEMHLYRQKYCGCYLSEKEARNGRSKDRG